VIWLLDSYQVKPGRLRELQAAFEARYLPTARRRGLTLVGQWVTPPLELPQGNELLVLWSLPDEQAFWPMRFGSGTDPEVGAWWREADALVLRRERRFLTDPAELRR
jgi:hypothetical protein